MADMVKLQATERVKRTGDKGNSTIDSVNRGTALCRHVTAICYHVIAIYRYLLFFAMPEQADLGTPSSEPKARYSKAYGPHQLPRREPQDRKYGGLIRRPARKRRLY